MYVSLDRAAEVAALYAIAHDASDFDRGVRRGFGGQSFPLDFDVDDEGFDRFPTGASLLNGGNPDLHGEPSCFQAFCEDVLEQRSSCFKRH